MIALLLNFYLEICLVQYSFQGENYVNCFEQLKNVFFNQVINEILQNKKEIWES